MESNQSNVTFEMAGVTRFRVVNWIIKRHWWFVGLVGLLILAFILFDTSRPQTDSMYAIEFIIFVIPLVVIGLLFSMLLRENQRQRQTARILTYKHTLSQEFAGEMEWEGLVNRMAHFPATVAPVEKSCLLIYDTITRQLTPAARWNGSGDEFGSFCSAAECQRHIEKNKNGPVEFSACEYDTEDGELKKPARIYCLPIYYAENMLGILQFQLQEGSTLTSDQDVIFRYIGDEIGIALKLGQDRRAFYEMRSSETALAERRSVSDYLHDHLGQNLGYLHLKIDQILSSKDRMPLERVFRDLEHMHEAADDAYEVLRNVLETIHPESAPLFTNLLLDHARKVSERSGIDMDFVTNGTPLTLPVETQHAIFYTFEETLSNAEKHSRATKIRILAEWGQDQFTLTITDNGVGFDPQVVDTDHHFGLDILNQRMAQVKGHISLTTSENFGTTVKIQVPNPPASPSRQLSDSNVEPAPSRG